jgi:phage terminase large subunit
MKSKVIIPSYLAKIYQHHYTYIVLHGGRGGGKSLSIVDYLIVKSFEDRHCQYLCAREIQNSLLASVFSVFQEKIHDFEFGKYFRIVESRGLIHNIITDVKIHFKGLWRDPNAIKGIMNLQRIFIDEASTISRQSWRILAPTVMRVKNPQIIVAFNPEFTTDVVYEEFVTHNDKQNMFKREVSFRNNPFKLPPEFFRELESLKNRDYENYLHVYEGHCITNSQIKIFKKGVYWDVLDEATYIEHNDVDLKFGLDLGFTPEHPTFGVRTYTHDDCIYVTHEAVQCGLDTNLIPDFLIKHLPQVKNHTIWVDSSRPETISAINRQYVESIKQSLDARGVEKGAGSVEDGIEHLKSHKMIYIHPRCVKLIDNFNMYSFKTDRRGNILRDIAKAHDDGIDALRYAEESTMKNKSIDYSKWNYENMRIWG